MTITAQALRNAAQVFAARTDSFAAGKADICNDLATKLEKFGSFVTLKQAEFAAKLVTWAAPQAPAHGIKANYVGQLVAELDLTIDLEICKVTMFRNGSIAVVHPEFGGGIYGFIESGVFKPRSNCPQEVLDRIGQAQDGGLKYLAQLGKITGRCCLCGLKLKDDTSIRQGIGPICAKKVGYTEQ